MKAQDVPPVLQLDGECMVCYDCLIRWARYKYTEGIVTYPLCKRCLTKRERGEG